MTDAHCPVLPVLLLPPFSTSSGHVSHDDTSFQCRQLPVLRRCLPPGSSYPFVMVFALPLLHKLDTQIAGPGPAKAIKMARIDPASVLAPAGDIGWDLGATSLTARPGYEMGKPQRIQKSEIGLEGSDIAFPMFCRTPR